MQGIQLDLNSLLAGLMSPQGGGGLPLQATDLQGDGQSTTFLQALQASLQGLIDSGQLELSGADSKELMAALQQLLGQNPAGDGSSLPLLPTEMLLTEGGSTEGMVPQEETELSPEAVEALMAQIQQALADAGMLQESGSAVYAAPVDPAMSSMAVNYVAEEAAPVVLPRQFIQRAAPTQAPAMNTPVDSTSAPSSVPAMPITSRAGPVLLREAAAQSPAIHSPTSPDNSAERPVVSNQPPPSLTMMETLKSALELRSVSKEVAGSGLNNLASEEGEPSLPPSFIGRAVSAATPGATNAAADARPAAPPSTFTLSLQNPQWQADLGNRVAVMARAAGAQGQPQVAEIRLNPANMGTIDVRVMVNDDQQTSVTFTAQHSAVREALETSLPRLREMFAGSGLVLAEAEVSDHSLQRNHHQGQDGGSDGHNSHGAEGGDPDFGNEVTLSRIDPALLATANGLDLYA